MNKDASDFMLQEYEQIAKAYFGLREQQTEWIKVYLSVTAAPLTLLVATLQLSGVSGFSLLHPPKVVVGLTFIVAALDVFVFLVYVATRMDMIMYARTINCVRGFFARDPGTGSPAGVRAHLVLPTDDAFPTFFELWHSTFVIVLMMGFVSGLLFGACTAGVLAWFLVLRMRHWCAAAGMVTLASAALHLAVYYYAASRREKRWKAGGPIPSYAYRGRTAPTGPQQG
jgi:hypothetical protein